MRFSFSFECDTCGAKGRTKQFTMWIPGQLEKFNDEWLDEVRRLHQDKTPRCSGTVYTRMTKHYGTRG